MKFDTYRIGIMKAPVEEQSPAFEELVKAAVTSVRRFFNEHFPNIDIEVFSFLKLSLSPSAGAYSALDFLEIGLRENGMHDFHFMIIITEVDLLPHQMPYVLSLPSQITNSGVISTLRLDRDSATKPSSDQVKKRLSHLIIHTLGHIFNLSHVDDPENLMYRLREAEDLDRMQRLTPEQMDQIRRILPEEARNQQARRSDWRFIIKQIFANRKSILRSVIKAHPILLLGKMPTMITTGLSVSIILFFSTEFWDIAGSIELYQLITFAIISAVMAISLLYRAFSFGPVATRSKTLTESTVVTQTTTLIVIAITVFVTLFIFFLVYFLAALTIFPRKLMHTWPTVDAMEGVYNYVRLGLVMGSMAILTGSLGGRAESKNILRHVLFIDDDI
jgi:predicted Zn-dependent protease